MADCFCCPRCGQCPEFLDAIYTEFDQMIALADQIYPSVPQTVDLNTVEIDRTPFDPFLDFINEEKASNQGG